MATPSRTVRTGIPLRSEHFHQLERLRRLQQDELEARIRELRECSTPTETVDVSDVESLSDNASSVGVGAAVVEITARTLQGIESALLRLRSGKYGYCSDCGSQIAMARLRALPFAERCRDCQELSDASGIVLAG